MSDARPSKPKMQGARTLSLSQIKVVFEREQRRCREAEASLQCERDTEVMLREEVSTTTEAAAATEAAEECLRQQVVAFASDLQVLARGLPKILEERGADLQANLVAIEDLSERVDSLRMQANEIRDDCRNLKADIAASESESQTLNVQLAQLTAQHHATRSHTEVLGKGAEQLHITAVNMASDSRQEDRMISQLLQDLAQLGPEADSLRSARVEAEERHRTAAEESHQQAESYCLAKRLEAEGLQRSLSLCQQRLQTKVQEASWWREQAWMLGHNLRSLRGEQELNLQQRSADENSSARGAPTSTPAQVKTNLSLQPLLASFPVPHEALASGCAVGLRDRNFEVGVPSNSLMSRG